jgi:hypothetical protein
MRHFAALPILVLLSKRLYHRVLVSAILPSHKGQSWCLLHNDNSRSKRKLNDFNAENHIHILFIPICLQEDSFLSVKMSGKSMTALSENWERDYALVRDAVRQVKKGDDTRSIEGKIKGLESELKNFQEDLIGQKRTKIADLRRSLLLRQAEDGRTAPVSAMSSSSRSAPPYSDASQSTEQILEQTRTDMRRQDNRLVGVSRDLDQLQDINRTIGDTAQLHVRLLDDIDAEAHGVNMHIQGDTRRVKQVAAASDTRNLRCAVFILVGIFVLLLVLKI